MSRNITTILIDNKSLLFQTLKNKGCLNIKHIFSINKALNTIKTIKFKEVRIIINGNLYSNFAKEFNKEINNFFVIPKIVIYTEDEEAFKEDNKEIIKDKLFKFCEIKTSLDELKIFINKGLMSNKFEDDANTQFTFEYINKHSELALHLYYKVLIEYTDLDNIHEFTKNLYEKYENSYDMKTLLGPIKNLKNIPIPLLAKYYAKAYTAESDFYKDMGNDLRNKDKDNYSKYIKYIKLLYESLLYKTFPLVKQKMLYRGSLINNEELEVLKKYYEEKKDEFPKAIVFSKAFLSFTKSVQKAEEFMNKPNNNNNNNMSKVLYILEKEDDSYIDYKLATHADIEYISYFPNEKEVLFFPFSSFEITNCTEDNNIQIITLKYLGQQYEHLIDEYIQEKEEEELKKKKEEGKEEDNEDKEKKEENKNKIEVIAEKTWEIEKIDNIEFKNQLNLSSLVNIKDITFGDLILKFKEYRKILKKLNSENGLNCIRGKIYIPGNFVNKNVKIIGAFNHNTYNYYYINNWELFKYKNEDDIRNNIKIKINKKEIKFSFYHKFNKRGEYDIEYIFEKNLDKINNLFSGCRLLTSLDLSYFDSSEVIH